MASTTTIKVSASTRDRVNLLGAQTHQTAEDVVRHALEEYERALFWREYTAAADARDEVESAEDAAEAALWDRATARDARA